MNNSAFNSNMLMKGLLHLVSNCHVNVTHNTVVGKNILTKLVFADSHYLGINKIYIKNNTLCQMIFKVVCKVSLNSMKIKECNIRKDMCRERCWKD